MAEPDSSSKFATSKLPDLRWQWVAAMALCAILLTCGVMWLLITQVRGATNSEVARAQLDAIRTSLTVGVGTGGAFALWLATRRQRSTEIQIRENVRVAFDDQQHREQLHNMTTFDLSERRITDLYTKAVEQLGSDKAPVRLGGLYALERLGNGNPDLRQTIVDVICAYLRMPYVPPTGSRRGPVEIVQIHKGAAEQKSRREELQVRLTAQRLLSRHLKDSNGEPECWGSLDLDLRESVLVDLDLNSCSVGRADFAHARFVGATHISGVRFHGEVWIFECAFEAFADLTRNVYLDRAIFTRTSFEGEVNARNSVFHSTAFFVDASFFELVNLSECRFIGSAEFGRIIVNTPMSEVTERQNHTTWPNNPINLINAKIEPNSANVTVDLPSGWHVLDSGEILPDQI